MIQAPAAALAVEVSGSDKLVPVLFLHELGGSMKSWQWLEPHLRGCFRAILVDLPGMGCSPSLGSDATLDDYADAIVRVLDRLHLEKVNVCGAALGSLITAHLAARYPERISAVMMVAVGHSVSRQYNMDRAQTILNAGMAAVVDYSLQKAFPPGFAESNVTTFQAYKALFLANDPVGYADASYAVARMDESMKERLRAMQCRTALVGGQRDPHFPPPVLAEVADLIPVPVRPVILPQAGHFPHIQSPEALAVLIRPFFLG